MSVSAENWGNVRDIIVLYVVAVVVAATDDDDNDGIGGAHVCLRLLQ